MNRSILTIDYTETTKDLLDPLDAELLDKAARAADGAYAPYSRFLVGAALRLENGPGHMREQPGERVLSGRDMCRAGCGILCTCQFPGNTDPGHSNNCLALRYMQTGLLESEKRAGVPIRVLLAAGDKVRIFQSVKDLTLAVRF